MKLEEIGFYTLSDERALTSSVTSPLWRCEMILTDRCNFSCLYCRGLRQDLRGDMPREWALNVADLWIAEGVKNVRLSGGEPTLWPYLEELVAKFRDAGTQRIAISTNGSADLEKYDRLIDAGVDDFSVSLDGACCALGDIMSGKSGTWQKVVNNIQDLAGTTYVTVGMVFTEENVEEALEAVLFADSLGVDDIRVIPSAQYDRALEVLADLPPKFLDGYPILKYRIDRMNRGRHVRGDQVPERCYLALDDMAVAGRYHFPCIIYMRESGDPIGEVGPNMREERGAWVEQHDPRADPICRKNCLDVCCHFCKKAGKR